MNLSLPETSLFRLDVLPAHCSIVAELDVVQIPRIRFKAIKHRRLRKDKYSDWSGWFDYKGEPIDLRWDIFWL